MSNATIRDVAREAAVSVASVSRVINGHTNVRPEMRERVEAVARKLGYAPHAGARQLSTARTDTIGVLLPDIHGEFFSELLRGMDREASDRGFQLLLSNIHAEPHHAVASLRNMRGRVDGLVVMAPHIGTELLFAHLPASLPVVLVNCAEHDRAHAELNIDNHGGATAMIDHLADLGHRDIVHLSGPAGNQEAAARRAGYVAAMARRGLPPRVIEGDFMEESGTAAALQLLLQTALPDALFAANDMMAIGAMIALRDAGIAVPEGIAIAGFDDIPLARMVSPGLTTMRVDIAGLGSRAVVRLADLIDGAEVTGVEPSLPELVPRRSTFSSSRDAVPQQPPLGHRP